MHYGSLVHSPPLSCLMTAGDENNRSGGSVTVVAAYAKDSDAWG